MVKRNTLLTTASVLIALTLGYCSVPEGTKNTIRILFNADKFYEPVATIQYSDLVNSKSLTIEIAHKYNTKHSFSLITPNFEPMEELAKGLQGEIRYRFIVNGDALLTGIARSDDYRIWRKPGDSYSRIHIFDFHLPLDGQSFFDTAELELILTDPYPKLAPYKDSITGIVAPSQTK